MVSHRSWMAVAIVFTAACPKERSQDEYARENDQKMAEISADVAARERENAPYTALVGRYAKVADKLRPIIPDDAQVVASEIGKATGRTIAPLERTRKLMWVHAKPTTEPEAIACPDRCDRESWIAADPERAGVVVLADVEMKPDGEYVTSGGSSAGAAYTTRYRFRAVLMPEKTLVADWMRFGIPASSTTAVGGIAIGGLGLLSMADFRKDMLALQSGRAPQP